MAKTNSGLLEFKDAQKVLIALDDATSEVKKAVVIDGDGVETDIQGAQPTGKKEITSTAEVNVANYATAQVVDADLIAGNIKKDVDILGVVGTYEAGASDFSTAEVTVYISGDFALYVPYLIEEEGEMYFDTLIADSGTYNIVMYNNTASGYVIDPINASATPIINVTGSAVVGEHGEVGITGDCEITISAGE